jgi:hypothetical protein
MYNLFVSSRQNEWLGEYSEIDISRCVRQGEYTEPDIANRLGDFEATSIDELKRMPCIFAHQGYTLDPKFGRLREISKRPGRIRIRYEIHPVESFLSQSDLIELSHELDIAQWELGRMHWAVKDIDLARALRRKGAVLPDWAIMTRNPVNITTHQFDVGLSFPGEARPLVAGIASELNSMLGHDAYFYDANYTSQLAGPGLDRLLQDIYRNRCKLIVVFIGTDYQKKDWCGLEFRVIEEIILKRDLDRVMYVRIDDGEVAGVFATDGYIDARQYDAATIARFIQERLLAMPAAGTTVTGAGADDQLLRPTSSLRRG